MYWVPPTKEEEILETPHRNISYWETLEELNNWMGSEHQGLGQALQINWCKSEPKCKKWTDAKKNQTSSYSFMMKNDNSHPDIWRRIPLKVSSALRLYLFNQLSQWCMLCKIPVRIALFTQDIFQSLQNNYYREFLDLFSFLSQLPNTWQNKPRRSFCHCLKGSSQQWWDGMAASSSYGWE